MPNGVPPQDYWTHMKSKGMSDELAGWIFHHKFGGDRTKASAAVKEGITPDCIRQYANEYKRLINSGSEIKESMVARKRKLSEAESLQEAMKLPGNTLWSPGTRSLVNTAFKVEEKHRVSLLREAENSAAHDEEIAKKLNETADINQNKKDKKEEEKGIMETEFHSNEGSHQSSGSETPPHGGEMKDPQNMERASGGSQLKEDAGPGVIDYPMTEGPSQDPLNACIIQKMDEGMSQVEAHNICNREVQMTNGMVREALKPMIKKFNESLKSRDNFYLKTINGLKETIKLQDEKLKETIGNKKPSDIIQMRVPQGPGGMALKETVTGETGQNMDVLTTIASNSIELESYRKDILNRYTQ